MHSSMSSSYKQLLNYLKYGHQGQPQKNVSNLPVCICSFDVDGYQGNLALIVIKITLVILGLWTTSAGMPLNNGIFRSLTVHVTCTCLCHALLILFIKLGSSPGHRLDYVSFFTKKLWTSRVSVVFCYNVTLNVPLLASESCSGRTRMFGHDLRSELRTHNKPSIQE